MNKRQNRLTTIADILLNNIVGSQEELLDLLRKRDCVVTQATLSRDLKTLRTSKVATEMGGYRYVIGSGLPADKNVEKNVDKVSRIAIESVRLSGQLLVIHTRNGYAGGVAYDIDDLQSPIFMGTIAGADTVFVAVRADTPRSEIFNTLSKVLPDQVMNNSIAEFQSTHK